ncbi:endonuclease/exonuclease/phosphatase family protein [Corynebacterium sp. AOP36-E1-14]|uniref:endonuclease/exonuclease/phosphatase family protein n=1 Tax=unclassified Corynebacterium TaxID=2624378 RepID=UPI004033B3B9
MKLISYNLHKHNAVTELTPLVAGHAPDALCVQEADTRRLPRHNGDLDLVHATTENRLGLAVYLRTSRLDARDLKVIALEKSFHDRVMKPASERLVMVRAHDTKHDRDVVVASFHAAPLTATNSLRRQQIRSSFDALQQIGAGLPSVMVGDFNYPLFQRGLRRELGTRGYEMSRSEKATYSRYGVLRGNYDFAVSRGFGPAQVDVLPQGHSDHLPIVVRTSLDRANPARIAASPPVSVATA